MSMKSFCWLQEFIAGRIRKEPVDLGDLTVSYKVVFIQFETKNKRMKKL